MFAQSMLIALVIALFAVIRQAAVDFERMGPFRSCNNPGRTCALNFDDGLWGPFVCGHPLLLSSGVFENGSG